MPWGQAHLHTTIDRVGPSQGQSVDLETRLWEDGLARAEGLTGDVHVQSSSPGMQERNCVPV